MITYFDTSVLLKLVVDDETGVEGARMLWTSSDVAATSVLAYAEARAALATAHRSRRLGDDELALARGSFEEVWQQLDVISITTDLVRHAGDLAERDGLRGYDAVHLAAALLIGAHVIASADDELCAAAAAHGLDVANPSHDERAE